MKLTISGLLLIVLAASSSAADKPDFSGVWKLNAAKSDYGPMPPPELFTRTIQHSEPVIIIIEEQKGPGTIPSSTRKMKTDGRPVEQTVNGVSAKYFAKWEGASLVTVTTIESRGVSSEDKMSLSPDGKLMTSMVEFETPQGTLAVRIAFDRQ
jgi:hypothetical protein